MASHNPVKILEISRVAPYPNSPRSVTEFSVPLTFFDTFWIKFPPVECLFFYQLTDTTLHHFNSVVLPKLKHSLSLTLLHYLPLAGKLLWPSDVRKPIIYYTPNDAVSLLVAESNADFHRLSGDDIRESPQLHHLIPELFTCNDAASCISLQITLFPNDGFCIGITTHHAVMDGTAAITLMKSWAHLCGKEDHSLLPELAPFLDRTVIKDPAGLDMVYLKNWLDYIGSNSNLSQLSLKVMEDFGGNRNFVRATFKLTREDVKKLREKILSKVEAKEAKSTKQLHLSTFVVIYAYVLVCLVKARAGQSNRNVHILFPADYRTRMNPPLPENYFGNCVFVHETSVKASAFMEENGIAIIAEKISTMIKEINEKGHSEGAAERLEKLMKKEAGEQLISIAGSIRFNFYGVDFGWGRPKKVEIVSIDRTGAIALAESRDGNGVEIGVVLVFGWSFSLLCLFLVYKLSLNVRYRFHLTFDYCLSYFKSHTYILLDVHFFVFFFNAK